MVSPPEGVLNLSGYIDLIDAIIGVLTRHPMLEEELITTLHRWAPGAVKDALAQLLERGKAKVVHRYGRRFRSFAWATYA